MKQINAVVVSNEELWPGGHLLLVRAPEITASVSPGQYLMVRCGEGLDMPLRRPLSVHRISEDGTLAFLFAVVGKGTEWLAQRKQGDTLDLFGPLGNGFKIDDSSEKLLLVAGGIGIAPLVAFAEHAMATGCSVTLLIGNRTASLIYPERLLSPGIKTVVTTEDGSLGKKGMVTDLLPGFIPEADQVFACGPLAMYRKMAEMPGVLKDKPTQVLLEAVLGCGVGACLGCTIETKHGQRLVCKDGPVFGLSDVAWNKIVAPPVGRRYFQEKVI